jgi:hypothetical protein
MGQFLFQGYAFDVCLHQEKLFSFLTVGQQAGNLVVLPQAL